MPEQPTPAEPFVPRTELSYWQAIADALNAAEQVGMSVGIDLDGTLTDRNAWSVVWDRAANRWEVAGYDEDDDQAAELAPSASVTLRPAADADADEMTIEAASTGVDPAVVAYGLRMAAAQFDEHARAQGIEPFPFPAALAVEVEQLRAQLAELARDLAEQITALGKARGWSTWAADFIHPDREFVDTGQDAEQPRTPAVGDRYVKRTAPDAGRTVTVNRVWTAEDGHTAVAYQWPDPRASYAGSACPLAVFHRTYRPEAQQ